jgi:hypothetical protein
LETNQTQLREVLGYLMLLVCQFASGDHSPHGTGPCNTGRLAETTDISSPRAEQVRGRSKAHGPSPGASLFFSRPNGRTNPFFVFPTLVYQFAVRIPSYRDYLDRKMTEDPKMLEKCIECQFRVLITEPFSVMMESSFGRLAVLIDGLGECEGKTHRSASST